MADVAAAAASVAVTQCQPVAEGSRGEGGWLVWQHVRVYLDAAVSVSVAAAAAAAVAKQTFSDSESTASMHQRQADDEEERGRWEGELERKMREEG